MPPLPPLPGDVEASVGSDKGQAAKDKKDKGRSKVGNKCSSKSEGGTGGAKEEPASPAASGGAAFGGAAYGALSLQEAMPVPGLWCARPFGYTHGGGHYDSARGAYFTHAGFFVPQASCYFFAFALPLAHARSHTQTVLSLSRSCAFPALLCALAVSPLALVCFFPSPFPRPPTPPWRVWAAQVPHNYPPGAALAQGHSVGSAPPGFAFARMPPAYYAYQASVAAQSVAPAPAAPAGMAPHFDYNRAWCVVRVSGSMQDGPASEGRGFESLRKHAGTQLRARSIDTVSRLFFSSP
jgi:hypothetical protein